MGLMALIPEPSIQIQIIIFMRSATEGFSAAWYLHRPPMPAQPHRLTTHSQNYLVLGERLAHRRNLWAARNTASGSRIVRLWDKECQRRPQAGRRHFGPR